MVLLDVLCGTAALSPHQYVHGAVHGQLAGPDDSALEPTQEDFVFGSNVLEKQVDDLRLSIARQCIYVTMSVNLFALGMVQICLASSWPLWISEASAWTILVTCLVLTSGLWEFHKKTLRAAVTLKMWFVIFTILAASYLSPWHTSSEDVLPMSIILLFFRIPALVMCNCISLVFLSNFAFLGLVIFRSESQGMSGIGIASSSSFSAISVIWVELVIFVTTFSLSLAIRSMLMFCAQLKMNGDNAAAQCSTKSALLHFLCDAVVTTDSDCCLVNNSQSLAAFLSLGNQNVEGASLLDFMIPLEAKRMQGILDTFKETEALASASNSALEQTGHLVNAFHTCLLDNYGYKIGIEALMIKHWSTQGEQYIIGLRESGDDFDGEHSSDAEHTILRSVSCASCSIESAPIDVPLIPNSRQMFLVIDVDDAKVCAASAGLQEAVGVMLQDMFQTSTVELLKRLQREANLSEANGEPLSLGLFSFSEMPMRMDGRDGTMSGTMQVLQHVHGSAHVLITVKTHCRELEPLLQPRNSKRTSLTRSIRSSKRSSCNSRRSRSKNDGESHGAPSTIDRWPMSL